MRFCVVPLLAPPMSCVHGTTSPHSIALGPNQLHRRARCGHVRMGTWVEGGSSSTAVAVPAPFAFNIVSDYQRWPEWSPWLSRVETFDADVDGATSKWHLKFRAVDVNWNSRVVERIPDERLSWESTSGIRNSGSLTAAPYDDDPSSCTVTVSVRYEIPSLLEKLLSTRAIANLVSRRLQADLNRFRALAEREQATDARGAAAAHPRVRLHSSRFAPGFSPQAAPSERGFTAWGSYGRRGSRAHARCAARGLACGRQASVQTGDGHSARCSRALPSAPAHRPLAV